MHWENPKTKEPFTPLPLPEVKIMNKFFENYSKDVLLPLDFLIIRVHQLLLEYGESRSSIGQYLKIFNRFRWFCFKENENNFNHHLLEQYVEYEKELLSKREQKQWKIRIVYRAQKLIKYIVDLGYFPQDPLKFESRIKEYCNDLEQVRNNFNCYLSNKKERSKATIDLQDYVLRQIFDCCNIQNLNS